jgi:hypothetical protein
MDCYANLDIMMNPTLCFSCQMRVQYISDRNRYRKKAQEVRVTKTKLHVKLNSAMTELLNVCLEVELTVMYNKLESHRTFISRMIDVADIPES